MATISAASVHRKIRMPEILRNVADKICRANPRCYASIEDGIEVAKQNLQCFLQFYPEHVSDKARVYYGLVRT